ncbi:hypothetical protein D6851_15915 [Altericroceibacterium spongiae]|uniref:Uncharacterized protein n=2 Tax=Altericroceibacterium spongiae TaxID=2320269 RepID=A0A420EAR3_9SPHN|nr:hypothetical protein D6851_15915 [Altericroceibacterium spongiae]
MFNGFLIVTDPLQSSQTYRALDKAISELPASLPYKFNSWFVRWPGDPFALQDYLRRFCRNGEDILVIRLDSFAGTAPDLEKELRAQGYL